MPVPESSSSPHLDPLFSPGGLLSDLFTSLTPFGHCIAREPKGRSQWSLCGGFRPLQVRRNRHRTLVTLRITRLSELHSSRTASAPSMPDRAGTPEREPHKVFQTFPSCIASFLCSLILPGLFIFVFRNLVQIVSCCSPSEVCIH